MVPLPALSPVPVAAYPDVVPGERDNGVVDLRFRALVGEDAWSRLPAAVQRRFSKRLGSGEVTVYVGEVIETRLSAVGRAMAFAARLIGAPLPLQDEMTGCATVAVMENAGLGGQTWTRTYERAGKFPQVIHSAKRFSGPTGLEEYVGCGIGMSLSVTEERGCLLFRSVGYFVDLGAFRLRIPSFLAPGAMEIVHEDQGDDRFLFKLSLVHRLFGELVRQTARFRDG